jgi:peptide subunit release factor 1 (eRF1)
MQETSQTPSSEQRPALRFGAGTLDRVMSLQAPEDGVLSVYLNVEPSEMQREGYEATLLDLWKPLRSRVRGTAAEARVEAEIAVVNAYVRGWKQSPGRSVAIFSSAPHDAFIPVALDVPVLAGARFGPRPFLMPLTAALDEYERYCVALVDAQTAHILSVWMGRIDERIEFTDQVPGRNATGGWSQAGRARHREYHVDEHMRHVVDELWRLNRRSPFDRLIIGGPQEALAAFKMALTRPLAARVAGEFAGEMFASDAMILERVRGIAEGAERTNEKALVEEILVRAPKRQLAATGWDDTLAALTEGSVHQLVLVDGVTIAGFACPDGHAVVKRRVDRCPVCDKATEPEPDLAAAAVQLAMQTDAHIEFVRGEAAELLRPHGAAAILRYQ